MRLTVQLPADSGSAHAARALIRDRFGDEIPASTLYDLLTVASELVANAARHGEGETIGLAIQLDDEGRVRGEVQNKGRGELKRKPIDFSRGSGLGLHIIDAIVERWEVKTDGVTRVFFELRLV